MLGRRCPLHRCREETYGNDGHRPVQHLDRHDFVRQFREVWNEYARPTAGYDTNLYFRTFQESTDTAGPLVTDFLLPTDGDADSRLNNGATINQSLHYIVVTFDSDMMTTGGTTGANSVLNPNNWALMKNGVLVTGGIGQVYYGMNEAATRSSACRPATSGRPCWSSTAAATARRGPRT